MTYFAALTNAMTVLSQQPNTIFIGQGVGCAGTSMTDSLKDVPPERLLEFPVAEDLQIMIDRVQLDFKQDDYARAHEVPYLNASGAVFGGLHILLDEQTPTDRRAAAVPAS